MSEEDTRDQQKTNPLITVSRWVGTLGGILALSNMVDDLVQWIEQIEGVLIFYRKVVNVIWRPVDWVLPFKIPELIKDYYVIGLVFAVTHVRISLVSLKYQTKLGAIFIIPFELLIAASIFPCTFVVFAATMIRPKLGLPIREGSDTREANRLQRQRFEAPLVLSWFGAVLLGFFVLLLISTAFTLARAS